MTFEMFEIGELLYGPYNDEKRPTMEQVNQMLLAMREATVTEALACAERWSGTTAGDDIANRIRALSQ